MVPEYFDEKPLSNKEKFWLWLALMIFATLGMGFFGTRKLSALIISHIFAVVFFITIFPVVKYGWKWMVESDRNE